MKKLFFNSVDQFIMRIILYTIVLNLLFLFSAVLLANEHNLKMVISQGRAVIQSNDLQLAKKRALDEALYLASLQGGAKIDGYSSIDEKTNLKENLLVRPSSQIVDFKVLDESNDETHFIIKIQAAVFHGPDDIDCNMNKKINLSYLKPKFIVSSKLPAWTNNLPAVISQSIFLNLQSLDKINLINKNSFYVNTNKVNKISHELDYESLTEDSIRIKNGEYSVIPEIKLDFAKSRLHRFSNEILFSIKLNLYKGSNYNFIDSFSYNFSLDLGNKTGYPHIDGFYRTSKEKIIDLTKLSLSKFHYRLLDKLSCMPLESEVVLRNNQILVDLGTNQGLSNGKVGLVSTTKNMDYSATDWSVLTVISANRDYSILEPLNPKIKGGELEGKIIRFMN